MPLDPQRQGAAIARLHHALDADQAGEPGKARAFAEEALRLFEAAEDATGAAAAHQLLAGVAVAEARIADAEAHLDAGLRLRDRTGDAAGVGSLLQDLLGLRVRTGDLDGARDVALRLVEHHRAHGPREATAQAMHQAIQWLAATRRLAEAERLCSDALFLLDQPADAPARAALMVLQSRLALQAGQVERARTVAEQALSASRQGGLRAVVADALHQLAAVRAAQGDAEAARRLLVEALDSRVLVRDDDATAATLQELAAIEAGLGRTDDAVEHLRHAAQAQARSGAVAGEIGAWHALAALCDAHDRVDAALEAGAALIAAAERGGDTGDVAAAWQSQAARRVGQGDLAGAARDLDHAVRALAADPVAQAVPRAMYGQVLAALGEGERARAELLAARAALEVADPGACAEIDAMLAELG